MKKIKQSLIALLLLLLLPSFALAVAIDDYAAKAKTPIYGFRGIKWGERASKYRDELEFQSTHPFNLKSAIYIKLYEKPTLGDAYIGRFEYYFDEKGFYQAIGGFDYIPNRKNNRLGENAPQSYYDFNDRFLKIYDACIKQWGTPKKEVYQIRDRAYISVYRWYSPITLPNGEDDFAIAELKICYTMHNKPFILLLAIYTRDGNLRNNEALDAAIKKYYQEFKKNYYKTKNLLKMSALYIAVSKHVNAQNTNSETFSNSNGLENP